MHFSPSIRQRPGAIPQRPTPSGPTLQTPEQQAAAEAQRSPCEAHPGARAQRRTPPAVAAAQRPEQQSLSSAQISSVTLQPGSSLQVVAPDGVVRQRPLQQSVLELHVSPATRQ